MKRPNISVLSLAVSHDKQAFDIMSSLRDGRFKHIVLTSGIYEHGLYGVVSYDLDALSTIRKNHINNITNENVSLFQGHRFDGGGRESFGTYSKNPKDISIIKLKYLDKATKKTYDKLALSIAGEYNDLGLDAVNSGKFQYLSCEIFPEYRDREISAILMKKYKVATIEEVQQRLSEDVEAKIKEMTAKDSGAYINRRWITSDIVWDAYKNSPSYGPTLAHVALTNEPFFHLPKISDCDKIVDTKEIDTFSADDSFFTGQLKPNVFSIGNDIVVKLASGEFVDIKQLSGDVNVFSTSAFEVSSYKGEDISSYEVDEPVESSDIDDSEVETFEDGETTYKPTKAMAAEAELGLNWRKEFGRGGTSVGIARARDIKNRANLSADTVKRMRSYFSRHEVDKDAEGFNPGEEGYPSNGRIAWALWGGDPGMRWARSQKLPGDTEDNAVGGADVNAALPADDYANNVDGECEDMVNSFSDENSSQKSTLEQRKSKMEELLKKFQSMSFAELNAYAANVSDDEAMIFNLVFSKAKAEDEARKVITDNQRQLENFAKKVSDLESEKAKVLADLAKKSQESFSNRVGLFSKNLEDKGVPQALISAAVNFCNAADVSSREANLVFSNEADKFNFSGDFLSVLEQIFSSVDASVFATAKPGEGSKIVENNAVDAPKQELSIEAEFEKFKAHSATATVN